MKITTGWLENKGACGDAVERGRKELSGGLSLDEVIARLDRSDWLIWLLHKTGRCNKRQIVKLACVAARRALRFVPKGEERPRKAVLAAEKWIRNPIKENAAAAAAAADAAAAAADDARQKEHQAICDAIRKEMKIPAFKVMSGEKATK